MGIMYPRQPQAGLSAQINVVPGEFLKDDHKIIRGIKVDSSARDAGKLQNRTPVFLI